MHTNIADLSWAEIREHIYPLDGSLPDTYVLDTTTDDWRRWVDLVNDTYRVLFRDTAGKEQDTIDSAVVLNYWKGDRAGDMPFASVFVGNVRVNCFFLAEDSIDGDIDPRDINSLEDHLHLIRYLQRLCHLLAKPVVVLAEGTRLDASGRFEPEPLLLITPEHAYTNAYWRNT
jgi:hypothetical protein